MEKSGSSHWEISVSCSSQKYHNTATPYLFFARLSIAHGRLKTMENFKLSTLRKWSRSLTRGTKYSDFTWKLLVFWKTCRWWEAVETGGSTVCETGDWTLIIDYPAPNDLNKEKKLYVQAGIQANGFELRNCPGCSCARLYRKLHILQLDVATHCTRYCIFLLTDIADFKHTANFANSHCAIRHLRVLLCFCFKTSLSAKPFMRKWVHAVSFSQPGSQGLLPGLRARPSQGKGPGNEVCHFHANQSHFHKNGFAPRLALKQRHKGTLKWPIALASLCNLLTRFSE